MADLPPTVVARLDRAMGAYVRDRLRQHLRDAYAGVPMAKFPEDLRVYEHLLWLCAPDAVIELGAQSGGSALWFRDRLRTLALYGRVRAPLVVSIDLDVEGARERLARADPAYAETITLVRGDVRDPDLPAVVGRLLPDGAACFVVEDSAHTYETTSAALEGFCRFVPPGGMFVVEDGCVDVEELRLSKDWPRGVLPAIRDWLATEAGSAFEVRRDLELYGVSCHPGGWLRRRR